MCATLTPGADNVINDGPQELLNTDQKSWLSYQPKILTQLGVYEKNHNTPSPSNPPTQSQLSRNLQATLVKFVRKQACIVQTLGGGVENILMPHKGKVKLFKCFNREKEQ